MNINLFTKNCCTRVGVVAGRGLWRAELVVNGTMVNTGITVPFQKELKLSSETKVKLQ